MTAFVLSALLVAAPEPGDEKNFEAQFQKDIENARAKGIEFLKKQQKADGTWEVVQFELVADMKGGGTALVALAMLEAGVPANDAAVAKAVEHLAKLESQKTYVVSLQTQVLARADAKKYKTTIDKNINWLLENAIREDGKLLGWSYPQNKIADGSNTHFAVMALHAAKEAGAKIEPKVWTEVRDLYDHSRQGKGWTYYPNQGSPTLSMTTCGVLGLSLAAMHDAMAKEPGEAVRKGTEAMIDLRGPSTKSEGYRLFATAELGRVLGATEFKAGRKEWAWYREGAEMLLKKQNADGSWKLGSNSLDGDPVLATAFSLYFLGPPQKK